MNNNELKSKIYQQLDQLDEAGLQKVNEMVTNYLKSAEVEDGWDSLSKEDKAAIEEGLDQVEKGMTVPSEEVMKKLDAKFGFNDL